MKRALLLLILALPLAAQDYSQWNRILATYYNPAHGFDYKALKARDAVALQSLRQQLARVNVASLDRKSQLAYWINVYNVNTVATIVENYPVDSIRDISTDPIIRLNVFKKERVPFGNAKLSLDQVENEKIREGFHDPRIHFAINCAAKSCPPMRQEAFTGARVGEQLEEQTRAFINSPGGSKVSKKGGKATLTVSKVMDFFEDDFDAWGGGIATFTKQYLAADKRAQLDGARVSVAFFDYNWDLNDWKR